MPRQRDEGYERASPCPSCAKPMEDGFGLNMWDGKKFSKDKQPSPGAFSICAYCGVVSVFGDDLTLRRPRMNEQFLIDSNVRIQQAVRLVHESYGWWLKKDDERSDA